MKTVIPIIFILFSSSAISGMNLGNVNGQLEYRNEYIPPLSEQDQRWRDYNPPAHTSSGQLERKWYWHPYSNGATYHNNYDHEIVINASGGTKSSSGKDPSNRCHISITVNGDSVADVRNNNHNLGKSCFATATIPKGARYSISSSPWDTWGDSRMSVRVLR